MNEIYKVEADFENQKSRFGKYNKENPGRNDFKERVDYKDNKWDRSKPSN